MVEINPDIGILVDLNDGYCPCAVIKDEDTKCPCKEFRMQESGECLCGRYQKLQEGSDVH